MKHLRTKYFRLTFGISAGASALFLGWLLLFGRSLAKTNILGMTDAVFAVLGLAAASFLLFCFMPYFQGDRRWYSISALFTAVFVIGATVLWQVPMIA